MIQLNKIYFTGNELNYINEAVLSGKIGGNGSFTNKCQFYFENRYNFSKVLLTTSCTSALEMAAILLDIKVGDEVIVPSYTFVSTVNAFVLRGAKIIFSDSCPENPNVDVNRIESLINPKTKALIVVHYAGIACDMDSIMSLAKKHNLFVVEDAAHAIDSFYKGQPLGSIGHLSAFSFHETKNIVCGEGGMLVINDERFLKRAEIIREMGTNRAAFNRGEVDKYGWVDIGSSYLLSEISAAFLYAQIECMDEIQSVRKNIWHLYYEGLKELQVLGKIILPYIPAYAYNNAHMFYFNCKNAEERDSLISHLKAAGISSSFHYLNLHKSEYYLKTNTSKTLINAQYNTDTLLRLPLYFELSDENINYIITSVFSFFK